MRHCWLLDCTEVIRATKQVERWIGQYSRRGAVLGNETDFSMFLFGNSNLPVL